MNAKRRKISLTHFAVVALALLMCWVAASEAAPYVILKQGNRKIVGTDIRAKSDGSIILQTASGNQTFSRAQIARAVADKPATWDRAKKMLDAGKFEQVIPILEQIIRDNRYLGWDEQAKALIPRAYAGKGDYPAAVKAFEDLFKANPNSKENEEILWSYREMLLGAKKFTKLEPALKEAIMSGSRSDAARAQIMRGDIRKAQGQLEPAALDYLRTVVLFKQQKEQQPEALFKAAVALEGLRHRRFKELYKQVVTDYPGSPYAKQARAKL